MVKIGGAQLERADARARLCEAVARARADGHELLVVHGGGNQIRELSGRLAIPDRYHDGLRITDAATAEVVLMVLGGKVNRQLVAALQRQGVDAVGISGADGATFTAAPLLRAGVDLGFVGQVGSVDPGLVNALLAAGFVPVLATVAPAAPAADGAEPADPPFYNLNADHAAGPLAAAFGCDALLFLTDVPGVLGRDGEVLAALSERDCAALIAAGVARGGMLPKLEAATMALRDNPNARIVIAPADGDDCVRRALQPGTGTRFVTAEETA